MALNSIGMREDEPGANRLERAAIQTELAETMIKYREANKELTSQLLKSFMDARETVHHLDALTNLQTNIPRSTVYAERAKASRTMREADKQYEDTKEISSSLHQSASAAFKEAKRDRRIGKMQRLIGKVLFVKNTNRLPILNR